ncbi:MAG: CHAD domain-containing protein [Bacteroidetes bacterium]|nr:CHAD domain-containing protein [Bacteroidota bacterium]
MAGTRMTQQQIMLDETQRTQLRSLADDAANDEERRRNAHIILAYADGASTADIAAGVGLSESRTRYWRAVFTKYGMEMFTPGFAPPVRRRDNAGGEKARILQLADRDRALLQTRLESERDDDMRKRITLILAYADGRETASIAQEVGLSESRTRYWRKAFERKGMALFPASGAETDDAPRSSERLADPKKKKPSFGVQPHDTFSEAGRKVLHSYFEDLLTQESHPAMGEDPEVVHKMRVASRRLRSAFEIFDQAFDEKTRRKYRKPLRRLGRALGNVRDLDVLLMHMRDYATQLTPGDALSFAPLQRAWEEDRDTQFAALMTHFASDGYRHFRDAFRRFVDTPDAGALPDPEVVEGVPRHIAATAPVLILRRYTDVLAFDPHLDRASIDLLHRLRIQCKKLRYTMECFVELLGPGGKKCIRHVIALQDYLGELQDGQAASDMITGFVSGLDARQSSRPMHERLNPAPLLTYLAERESHKHSLLLGAGEAWARFNADDARARMLHALLP